MRLAYLDVARGVALVLMVVNHTARYWLAGTVESEPLIYLTTSGAGPTFLFLVGFVLPLSYRTSPAPGRRALRRAAGLAAAGYALNVVLWPQQPLLGSNVLHTIAAAVLLAPLARPWLAHPLGRWMVAAIGVALYASFVLLFEPISAWVRAHPLVGMLAFFDFPLWPWLGLVGVGLALGAAARDLRDDGERVAFHARLGLAAVALAAGAQAWEWWRPITPRLSFGSDLLITDHWVPYGASTAWVLAWVFGVVAACFFVVERARLSLRPLVVYGRAALFLYVAHHVLVVTLGQRALGLSLASWPLYWLATCLLLVALVPVGAAWTALTRRPAPTPAARADLSAAA